MIYLEKCKLSPSMIFILYPSMIVKDAQRYSIFYQTITFH